MLLYATIARRDATVLVEAVSQGLRGNFSHVTLQLLERESILKAMQISL